MTSKKYIATLPVSIYTVDVEYERSHKWDLSSLVLSGIAKGRPGRA